MSKETLPPPTPEEAESIRRIRRGCLGSAILIAAIALMLIFMTGNLAYSLLLLVAFALVLLRHQAR